MTATFPGFIDTVKLAVAIGTTSMGTTTYAQPVLINTARSFSNKAQVQETIVPRVDDPTQPGEIVRIVTATDTEVSGEGILDTATYAALNGQVGQVVPLQISVGDATGDLVATGDYLITECMATGQKHGDLVTASLKFVQASAPTFSTKT